MEPKAKAQSRLHSLSKHVESEAAPILSEQTIDRSESDIKTLSTHSPPALGVHTIYNERLQKEFEKKKKITLPLARIRETQAAVNFAPPDLNRLDETYTRPRRTYNPAEFRPENDRLCANCASLDLPAIFRHGLGNEMGDGGIQVRKGIPVGYSDEIYARATCPFCRLLVDMGDSNMPGDERDVEFWWIITLRGYEVLSTIAEPLHEIRDFDSQLGGGSQAIYLAIVRVVKPPPGYRFEYRTIFKELTYLGLMETDVGNSFKGLSLRSTGGPEVFTGRIRDWLLRCGKHKSCSEREAKRMAQPDGFCLFDITALKVVDAFGHEPYIALSYPWSQVDQFENKREEPYVREELPKVLQDVVRLVKGLGLGVNHIWMDRLCVNQDNDDQKTANINAMGDIYEAAFATIILAVPSKRHLEQGIPGLSAPRLPYQRVEKVGNLTLATTYPSLEMAIATSQWNTRAWTFQEGLLSSRCILFGPEQSHFECAEMGCCESIQEPDLAVSEQDHLIPYKSRLRNPFLDTYDFNSLYWRLVRDYTGRDMSLASDSLHAFTAFTTEFERAGQTLTWGLPISNSAVHLLWEHEPWDFRDINRRDEFPSWSWAGWSGTAAMNFPLHDAASGKEISCTCTIADESSSSPPRNNHILICKARSAKVHITGQSPLFTLTGTSGSSSIMLDCGMNIGNYPEDISPDKDVCLMMEICRIGEFVHGVLIVEKKRDDVMVFERIGSGFMELTDFENANAAAADSTSYREFKLV